MRSIIWNRRRHSACIVVAGWVAMSSSMAIHAQTPGRAGAENRNQPAEIVAPAAHTLSAKDAAFLKQVAENNLAEIESGKLALEKSTDTRIQTFARQMVDDHGKAGAELANLAASKGFALPTAPTLIQQGKLKLLGTAGGGEFDRVYAETQGLQAHRDTIQLFENMAQEAQDPAVRAFAVKTLPTLRHHLDMARLLPGMNAK